MHGPKSCSPVTKEGTRSNIVYPRVDRRKTLFAFRTRLEFASAPSKAGRLYYRRQERKGHEHWLINVVMQVNDALFGVII